MERWQEIIQWKQRKSIFMYRPEIQVSDLYVELDEMTGEENETYEELSAE